MIIDDHVFPMPKMERVAHSYFKVSDEVGVKLAGAWWRSSEEPNYSIKAVKNSDAYKRAKTEYANQLAAACYGLGPRPIKLCFLLRQTKFWGLKKVITPALFMEHIDGLTLDRSLGKGLLSDKEATELVSELRNNLDLIKMYHCDLHYQNIMCTWDENNKLKRCYAIDFESCDFLP